MSEVHEINFRANPMQAQFIQSKARADLFSSRMREGKSTALAWTTFHHARLNPGAIWVLIRDTWENMQATTMKSFFQWFPPGVCGNFHAGKKTFTWASGVAEGEVQFLGMDDPQDASKLMSREIAGFGIDEAAPAVGSVGVDEMIFDIALARRTQPDMKWYGAKVAENNPDETHWTHRRFVDPGEDGFVLWQPAVPENERNLPPGYYGDLRLSLGHRPDLIRRFIDGEFGYQQEGKAVTPQWSDRKHLFNGLNPIPRYETILLWDFGSTPCCIITQVTPAGKWNILYAVAGESMGVEELIADAVRPILAEHFHNCPLRHIGDPAGNQREQTSIERTPVKQIKAILGGPYRNGPRRIHERVDPLQAVLNRSIMQVDKRNARLVWHALRGGWHYRVARSGVISTEPEKTHPASDVGDSCGYGAAVLFPTRKLWTPQGGAGLPGADMNRASFFGSGQGMEGLIQSTMVPGLQPGRYADIVEQANQAWNRTPAEFPQTDPSNDDD